MKNLKSILIFVAAIFVAAYYDKLPELFIGAIIVALIVFIYDKSFRKRAVDNNEVVKEAKHSTAFKIIVSVLLFPLLLVAIIGGGGRLLESGTLPNWLEFLFYFTPSVVFTALLVYAFYRFSGIFIKDESVTPESIAVEQDKVKIKSSLSLQLAIGLFAVSPFACLFLLMSGGFEGFVLGPAAMIVFSIIVGVMIRIFRKYKSDATTVLAGLLVVILSAFLVRISVPIIGDGNSGSWFSANFLSADSDEIFSPLLSWFWIAAILYIYAGFRYLSYKIVSGIKLKPFEKIAAPLAGFILIGVYVLIFFMLKLAAKSI